MKKIIYQITLIFILIFIWTMSVCISHVNAESVSLSAGTVKKGETFSVGLSGIPAGGVAYQANVKITYSDGSTKSGQKISYLNYLGVTDTEQERSSLSADVAGNATITLYNIVVTDENSKNIQTVSSVSANITITDNTTTAVPNNQENPTNPNQTQNQNGNEKNEQKEPEIVNPKFKEVSETVYATQNCNVRSSCSSEIDTNKIGGLTKGQEVKRTGTSSSWSRIVYNGKEAYVASRLLTTEKPENEETEKDETENVEQNNDNENIEISNEEKLKEIQENIGVLPEVGINIAVYLYIILTVIVLVGIIFIKIKEEK